MPDLSLLDDILLENPSLKELQRQLSSYGYELADLETRDVAEYRGKNFGTMAVLFFERRVRDLGSLHRRREQAVVYKDEERGRYVLRRYELAM